MSTTRTTTTKRTPLVVAMVLALLIPWREPESTCAFRTHVLRVSGDMPRSLAMALNVAHSDG